MKSRPWIEQVPWEMVIWQNEQLCKAKLAHHGPTSDGRADCKALWEATHKQVMNLVENFY